MTEPNNGTPPVKKPAVSARQPIKKPAKPAPEASKPAADTPTDLEHTAVIDLKGTPLEPKKSAAPKADAGPKAEPAKPAAAKKVTPAPASAPKTTTPPVKAEARPPMSLSKEDYARTTKATPDATAVIPAVKDAPAAPAKPAEPAEKSPKPAARKPWSAKPKPEPVAAAAAATAVTPPAPPAPAAAASKPAAAPTNPSSARTARLSLTHIEPWSVTKLSFVVSVALMIVSVVAVAVFWSVLQITGVWSAVNDSITNVLSEDSNAFDITDYLGFSRLVGLTLLLSALNVVFMTALATIAAHLYNIAANVLGGIEVRFTDRT